MENGRSLLRVTKDKKNRRLVSVAVCSSVLLSIVGIVLFIPGCSRRGKMNDITYEVKKGDLTISVLVGGNLKAVETLDVKSEVERQTAIISLIPEGTVLTEKDVEEGKVLVELDSSELREDLTQQEINYQSALSNYIQAQESYDIQVKQNESNIKKGEVDVKFARIDLNKYLGEEVAAHLSEGEYDFGELIKSESLGGEALQEKRKLESAIDLAKEEVSRSENSLHWTAELEAKGFVTKNELDADKLALKRKKIELEQAETALELFIKYEFPKKTEKLLSDYLEKRKELERILAKARSELAQKEAALKSAEATHTLRKARLDDINEQIEKCTIKATQPGIVVYPTDYWRGTRTIEEGAEVRKRQTIITIPDISTMAVDARVHESSVSKVKEGQRTWITVDAFPDQTFTGKVEKIALLADTQRRWLNPDLQQYTTTITIDGNHNDLRPGMSAQVEILVEELKDVIRVPVEAVTMHRGQRVCYVKTGSNIEPAAVEIGSSNNNYVEIKSGLREGQQVLFSPPQTIYTEGLEIKPDDSRIESRKKVFGKESDKKEKTVEKPLSDTSGTTQRDSDK